METCSNCGQPLYGVCISFSRFGETKKFCPHPALCYDEYLQAENRTAPEHKALHATAAA